MKRLFTVLLWVCSCLEASAQSQIQSGYAVVTPSASLARPLSVVLTYGEDRGFEVTLAAVPPSPLSTSFSLSVSNDPTLSKDLGIAVVNPQLIATTITLKRKTQNGQDYGGNVQIVLSARGHTARFFGDFFAISPTSTQFSGSVIITATNPVAVVGIRFRGGAFAPVPATVEGGVYEMPKVGQDGGDGSLIIPQLAFGGGWTSELVVSNPNQEAVDVRISLFKSDGSALLARINGINGSSFTSKIQPGGIAVFTQTDDSGRPLL